FTLDAALEVGTGDALDEATVFEAIESLVAKSMVATQPIAETVRYRLLDATRAYTLEFPISENDRTELSLRHASYFRRLLEQFGAHWSILSTGTERTPHVVALNNVRAALEWCFGANGNSAVGAGLAAAAMPVFLSMSLISECHRWSRQALDALDDTVRDTPVEMQLQAGLGISLTYSVGTTEEAHAALTRGLELAETLRDPVE